MTDKCCFVQFSHPGREHGPKSGCNWHKSKRDHRRKFMQLRGKWIEGDDTTRSGDLWAWGEWEPNSYLICKFNTSGRDSRFPRYLWNPYYIPKDCYGGLHNTDPFIFGEHFLYSNCGQPSPNKVGLKHLDRGSVIAFGSGKKIDGQRRWTLDTVLVVRDFVDYDMRKARTELKDWAPPTFLDVTGGPMADHDEKASTSGACTSRATRLRLYRGATPDDPVHGMFSFFPAIQAGRDSGFPRPVIDLPSKYFNPSKWQGPKGLGQERTRDDLLELWNRLVKQVCTAGLVLGIRAELPERQKR